MDELGQIKQAISTLEAQRAVLGDAVVDLALSPLHERLIALQGDKHPEQQLKLVTMLFLDIAGYTALTQHMDPEELMEVIDEVIARLAKPVTYNGGRIVRYQGDGFKAVFGIPVAHENDAEKAVHAGLSVQRIAREIAAELERERGLPGFSVRVGIATGLVLAGGGNEGEDTVMGEPVNLAARLETAAQPGAVLIAHQTYRHVRGVFDMQPLGELKVKGFADPVLVYQVQAAKPLSFRTRRRGVEGIETRMVGRETELNDLQSLFLTKMTDISPFIVTIVGEPGIGKSRLMYEFENWIDLQPKPIKIYRARARHETHRQPYRLLHNLIATEFNIFDSDSEATAKEKLERGIASVAGENQRGWASFIGHILGFDYTGSLELRGILEDSQQIRNQAFHAAAQLIFSASNEGSILVMLEDIHWADDSSLDFFEYLSNQSRDSHLMMVCAARNTLFERRPDWGKEQNGWFRLDVSPLTGVESQKLVNEILRKAVDIPPALKDLIVRQAEGNPFYVEEVIKMLVDDGVILIGAENWHVKKERFVEGKIPQTLAGVIQARLDGLPVAERKVLDRASVVGRVFWEDLVAYMQVSNQPINPDLAMELHTELTNLQGRELIFQREQSSFSETPEYIFKNAVLRDVAYQRMLKKLRRVYHTQVAEWLYKNCGDRVGEYAGRIGEHYDHAGQIELAAEWYTRAGKQAQETFAPEMAKDYYQKALSFLEKVEERTEVHISRKIEANYGLSQVLIWLGLYTEAVEGFRRMAKEAESLGDTVLQARAWHGIAEAQMHRGEFRAANDSADQVLTLAQASGDSMMITKALWMKAWGAFRLGEMERAISLAEQVASLSHQLQEPSQMAHSFNLLGVLQSTLGHYEAAAGYFEQALTIFRKVGNRLRAMPLMNNLGVIAEARGDYQHALRYYQEALNTALEMGNRDGEMVYLSNQGGAKVELGEYRSAEEDLTRVIDMAGPSGQDVLSSTYSFLALACLGLGKTQEALVSAQNALSMAEEMESPDDMGLAWRALGRIAAFMESTISTRINGEDRHKTMGAEECFAESERIYKEIQREDERARTLREWAKYHFVQGNPQTGMRMWKEARAIFTQLGAYMEVDRMEEIHAT